MFLSLPTRALARGECIEPGSVSGYFRTRRTRAAACGFGLRALFHFSSVLSLIRSLRRTRLWNSAASCACRGEVWHPLWGGRHIDLVAAQCERALPVVLIAATPSISSPKCFSFPLLCPPRPAEPGCSPGCARFQFAFDRELHRHFYTLLAYALTLYASSVYVKLR